MTSNNKKKTLYLDKKSTFHHKYFVLCESCLWSATSYSVDNSTDTINACPVCPYNRLEFLPLRNDTSYPFDYNPRHGVSVKSRKII